MEQIALFIGYVTILIGLSAFALLAILLIMLVVLYAIYRFPKIHFGKPKHEIQLNTYDSRTATAKFENGLLNVDHNRLLIQNLTVKNWFGFSSKNNVTWYFGLIRFGKSND